nr:MAG TPA: hypothetical protein [Caudoviricetes sp.]
MRTLEQFQKEVLAPLRKERDDKQEAAREIRSKAAADYMQAKKEITEKEQSFTKVQEEALQIFTSQQLIDRKAYHLLLTAERTDACAKYDKAKHDEKIAKRRANEEYMDKVGIAFAEYNKERVAAGEQPVYYDNRREMSAEEHNSCHQEDGWPADPAQEVEA